MTDKQEQSERKPDNGKVLIEKAAQGVASGSRLPMLGSGFEIYNINQKYTTLCKNFRSRIFTLMKAVLENGGYALNANAKLEDVGELTPCTEFLLDRAMGDMDFHENNEQNYSVEIRGPDGTVRKANDTTSNQTGGRYAALLGDSRTKEAAMEEKRLIAKPQLQFKQFIVNDDAPFVLKLRVKHHDSKQKAHSGQVLTSDNKKREWLSDLDTTQQHPYAYEILNFKIPDRQLASNASPSFKSLEETPLIFVETIEGLKQMIEKLNSISEFAVDVEHHEYRSFLGLTCLVQISTRDEDYVVDPFPIWDSMHLLNEPFTDPKILKVFHGADSDIVWLQRDFGIYVVNMLDTYVFMRLLDEPKRSLQVLVSNYCNVNLNKFYQRADWRVRPLDKDHLTYARSDTHYLLYCCDKLCQRIKQHNKLTLFDVYNASKQICLKRFEQPRFNPKGYLTILEKSRRLLNNRQMQALERLWKWRDQTARVEDESYSFVLPDHMLYQIAETLPREATGVLSCCSPIPPLVKRDVFLIHRFVKEARDLPLEEKTNIFDTELGESLMLEAVRRQQQKANQYTREFSRLDCRFDQSEFKVDDNRPQIETRFKQLFDEEMKMASGLRRSAAPILPFQPLLPRQQTNKKRKLVDGIMKKLKEWATPYDSYVVEMMSAQREEPPEKRTKLVHSTLDAKKSG